jgi:hypothetical protein
MKVNVPNNKDRLKKVVLGNVPSPATLEKILSKPVPKVIHKILEETQEDLEAIKNCYEQLGVEVLAYPVNTLKDSIHVRNGFIVVDDHLFVTQKLPSLNALYDSVPNKTFVTHGGGYCPDIYIHDDYAILDRLDRQAYVYWKGILSPRRKIITASNEGHSDGIYCNVADKIWLTNGDVLPYKKYWPDIPVLELSTTNAGSVNNWEPVESLYAQRELTKTNGRYLISKHTLTNKDVAFIDQYLDQWVGYCEETLFDINLSIIDKENIMVISQNSLVYDKLESLGIKIHKVPFRHRFFWDGGIHCITNDLVRG